MNFDSYLAQIGLNLTSSFLYDKLKTIFSSNHSISSKDLKTEIARFLSIDGAEVKAEQIIKFLADNGDIKITNSSVQSNNSVLYGAGRDTSFSLKDNVVSSTSKSEISVGKNAQIKGSGGAFIHQDDSGSIHFAFKNN